MNGKGDRNRTSNFEAYRDSPIWRNRDMCGEVCTDYTQKQRDYVASIEEKDLRHHLLHQVRLRDYIRKDRDKYQERIIQLEGAVVALRAKLNAVFENGCSTCSHKYGCKFSPAATDNGGHCMHFQN
jgi:hypothetical protein